MIEWKHTKHPVYLFYCFLHTRLGLFLRDYQYSKRLRLRALLTAVAFISFLFANGQKYAVSPSPYPVKVKQPDGSMLLVHGQGNEQNHITITEDGFTVVRNESGAYEYARLGRKGILVPSGITARNPGGRTQSEQNYLSNLPRYLRDTEKDILPERLSVQNENLAPEKVSGTMKLPVLLIGFPDIKSQFSKATFTDFMNKPGFNATGSFRDFYLQASGGKFEVNSDVLGWYVARHPREYYSTKNGDDRAGELVAEAIDAAEAAGVNFSVYDNNKDGRVDHIIVVHAGQGAEEGAITDYIWSHTWNLFSNARNYDGVNFDTYTILPETRDYGMVGIGVFCHEFGHFLGIPDLYDVFSFDGTSEGLGYWCLMASGSWLNYERTPSLPSAWVRERLGWIIPVTLGTPGIYTALPASSGTQCYKLATPDDNEYFLLENRYRSGFDSALPGNGLAIYHINTRNFGNFDEKNKLVDLEEADGRFDLDDNVNKGDAGDLFPGSSVNRSFNDLTNPNAQTYDEKISKIDIREIEQIDSIIKFRVGPGFIVGNDLTYLPENNSFTIARSLIDVSMVLKNAGNLKAGPFSVMLYVSADDTLTASDYKVLERSFEGMGPGSTSSITFSVDLSSVYPPIPVGKYYIGFMIDYQNSVEELNELNNSYVFRTNSFDLRQYANLAYIPALNNLFVNGNEVEASLRIRNSGNSATGQFRVGYYLSRNYPVSASDYLVGEETFAGLSSGEFINASFKANIENQIGKLPPGEYYLGFIIDPANSIGESVETDNAFTYSSHKISNVRLPNLTFDLGHNKLTIAKHDLTVDLSILNNGNMPSDTCRLGIYFSGDSTITESDYLLASLPVGFLGKGEGMAFNSVINLPSVTNVPAGKYFVGYLVDHTGRIEELTRKDNSYLFRDQPVNYSPVETVVLNKIICDGSSCTFMDSVMKVAGIYKFPKTGVNGKDTLFVVDLTVNPVNRSIVYYNICPGDSVVLPSGVYRENGVYIHSFSNHFGCDSIVYFNLKVNQPTSAVLNRSICQGDTIRIGRNRYFSTGTYSDTIQNRMGCDSTITLRLVVHPLKDTVLTRTVCQGDTVRVGKSKFFKSGTYRTLLTSHLGCDSTITLKLLVNPVSETTLSKSVCEGGDVKIGNSVFNKTGTYKTTLKNRSGCDSIVTLILKVNPVYKIYTDRTVCRGDTVRIGKFKYFRSGVYTSNLTSKAGCDSLVVLNLKVNNTDTTRLTKVICSGTEVKIGTTVYKNTGNYKMFLSNRSGCDSVILLNLTVVPLKETRLSRSICSGDSMIFAGKYYKTTGTYSKVYQAKTGCDSTVYLNLTVNPSHLVKIDKKICIGSAYVFGKRTLTEAGTYTDSLKNRYGCDSVVVLTLGIVPLPDVRLSAEYTIVSSDVLTLDAGTGFAQYNWSTGESSQKITIDRTKGLGSKLYSVTVSDSNACKSTARLVVTIIDNSYVVNDKEPNLKVYPNPSTGKINLLVEKVRGQFDIQVFNGSGQVVYKEEDYSTSNNYLKKVDLSRLIPGYYMVRVTSGADAMTEKFIITDR